MINKMIKIIAATAALALSLQASAGLFEFSYIMSDGTSVTGTLTGDANGQYIENVADVTVQFDGQNIANYLYDVAYTSNHGWDNSIDGIVSFDANLNNFLFIDSNYPSDYSYTTYFYMINYGSGESQSYAYSRDLGHSSSSYPIDAGAWSISQVDVPEPGTLALMGLGLIGITLTRRRLNKA